MINVRTLAAFCTIAGLWGTPPLGAQAALSVEGSLLRPGVDTFNVLYGGQAIGRAVLSTVAITEHGSPAWSIAGLAVSSNRTKRPSSFSGLRCRYGQFRVSNRS